MANNKPDDFLAVMKTSDRMCASYARCMDGCPFYCAEPNKMLCNMTKEIWEDPADFLAVIKEWAMEHPEMPCDAYNSGYCMGTKECDACDCGGDMRHCTHYPEKRGNTK